MNVYGPDWPSAALVRCGITLWALCGCHVLMAGEDVIVATGHERVLRILGQTQNAPAQRQVEALKRLRELPRQQQLEALAYALNEDKHTDAALVAMHCYPDLRDPRLAPYLAKAITTSDGRTLYDAVRLAALIPDPVLLPALIDYALDSDYSEYHEDVVAGHFEHWYDSVFEEAATAIFRITGGKLASDRVPRGRLLPDDQRKALVAKWRTRWSEMQREKLQ